MNGRHVLSHELEEEIYAAVCHYTPNSERRQIISLQKELLCLDELRIISTNDASPSSSFSKHLEKSRSQISQFTEILCACSYVLRVNRAAAAENNGVIDSNISRRASRQQYPVIGSRMLSASEVSLNLKHREALSRFLLSRKQYVLVLEDDAIPDDNTLASLLAIHKHLRELPIEMATYVDLGGGCNLKYDISYTRSYSKLNEKVCLVEPMWASSRTTCAYLLNKSMASEILASSIAPYAPIDFEILACMQDMTIAAKAFKCFCTDPPCFSHGSQLGTVRSSIQTK